MNWLNISQTKTKNTIVPQLLIARDQTVKIIHVYQIKL